MIPSASWGVVLYFITLGNLFRGILFTCCIQLLLYSLLITGLMRMVKGKGRQRTRHEGPEGEQYSNYSFFNLAARWGGWLTPRTARFTPEKESR